MPGLFGKNEQVSNVNQQTGDLQKMLIQMLSGGGNLNMLFAKPGDNRDWTKPYEEDFRLANDRAFAQAKESVGNLTGSSLGNILGREAAGAATQQGAQIANMAESMRQNDANRMAQLVQTLLNSNAGGVTNMYRPGLIDYAAQGASALAGAGAFNDLFKRTKT